MNDRGGSGIGCFEIETDAAKFTNVGIAEFGQNGYLIEKEQLFIEDKTRVGSFDKRVMELS